MKYVNFERNPDAKPNINNYDGLIVLGGPMNVDQTKQYHNLVTEIEIIKRAIDSPVLALSSLQKRSGQKSEKI
jgi:GMP synthase (glutamine-hydrolysing)